MEVTVLYVEHCPHVALAAERVVAALDRLGIDGPVLEQVVESEERAAALGFGGSPTVMVDGVDLFPARTAGLSCRLYATEDGAEGTPSVGQLVEALRR